MREHITIKYPEEIDIGRHAVIEASAGTGKTYTIENLFIRCLLEERKGHDRPLKIDEVLVVTFTEKATGELKLRIREKLHAILLEVKTPEKEKALLKDALENFDSAGIFTIHGFCRTVLKQYAFENGEPFVMQVEDDADLYEKALKEQMRRCWKGWFGKDLAMLLEISGFTEKESWVDDTVDLAVKYRPECGERMIPDITGDPKRYFLRLVDGIKDGLGVLAGLVGKIDHDDIANSAFNVAYGRVCAQAKWLDSRRAKIILPMLKLLSLYSKDCSLDIAGFSALMHSADDKDRKFRSLIDNNMKEEVLCERLPNLSLIVEKMEELRRSSLELSAVLRVSAVKKLKNDVAIYKREHGLMSYEDMLKFVDLALGSGNMLKEELRKRYACALIDEFQDTDLVQWRILGSIFLTEENTLFVIGDPKQSIYGFRGADVDAYLGAKAEMLEEHGANYYSLATNWRSTPPLINGFNRLFSIGGWFPGEDIRYVDVSEPPALRRKTRTYSDSTKRAAITAIDMNSRPEGEACHKAMARFMAKEIAGLLEDGGRKLIISKAGFAAPLKADDICILIKGRSKAPIIERALDDAGIPHSFYKKSGLYRSDEAIHVRYLLAAAEDPSEESAFKKALLTPFFMVKPSEISGYSGLPPSHSLKMLFQKWYGYAGNRKWPLLFQSMVEDTGIYYDKDITERRIANYRQIFEALEKEALSHNLDIVDLLKALDRYRLREQFEDEAFDIERLETEEPKVKIMTIHASKGLEFPVVFIADGFADAPDSSPYWKYHDDTHRVVYDLAKDPDAKGRLRYEEERDSRQLFYVALTRAKHKLYIPKFSGEGRSKGPIAYIVNEALDKAWINGEQDGTMLRFVDLKGNDIQTEPSLSVTLDAREKDRGLKAGSQKTVLPKPVFPGISFSFEDRLIEIESYSRLKERSHAVSEKALPAEKPWITYYDEAGMHAGKDDDDTDMGGEPAEEPSGQVAQGKSDAILRPGSDTGSMLHEILEEVDFAVVAGSSSPEELLSDPDTASLVDRKLKRFGFIKNAAGSDEEKDALYKEEASRIIWNTLNTPLPQTGHPLSTVGPADKLVELEFYYPLPRPGDAGIPRNTKYRDGFLMGYIDLVFRSDGRYFFLDWKSNYVEAGYSSDAIMENIKESGYDLQYKVYSIAVLRWLKATIKDFDYNKNFGGIYYIYLRGMNAKEPGAGYVHIRPESELQIKGYEKELFHLVNNGALV